MTPAPEITESRRRDILWIVWVHGPGTPASITALYKSHIRDGRLLWGSAPWSGAAKEPYEAGVRQHLDAMKRNEDDHRVTTIPGNKGRYAFSAYDWNREVLTPRASAVEVLELRRQGASNDVIATRLGLSRGLVSALYHDPFGFREKERKEKYCGGCGAPKQIEQGRCLSCVRKAREAREDKLESLLPDPAWAERLPVTLPVDFGVTPGGARVLIIHTDRGKIERLLRRGESWQRAIEDVGVLR